MRKPQRRASKVSNVLVAVEDAYSGSPARTGKRGAKSQSKRVRNKQTALARYASNYRKVVTLSGDNSSINVGSFVIINGGRLNPVEKTAVKRYVKENSNKLRQKRKGLMVSTTGYKVLKVEILDEVDTQENVIDIVDNALNDNIFDGLNKISLNDIKKHISMVKSSKNQPERSGNTQMVNGWALEQTEKSTAITNWNNFKEFEMTGEEPIALGDKEKEALENFKTFSKEERRVEILRLLQIIQNPKVS